MGELRREGANRKGKNIAKSQNEKKNERHKLQTEGNIKLCNKQLPTVICAGLEERNQENNVS